VRSNFVAAAMAMLIAGTGAWAQKAAVIDMQGAILQTKDGQKASADLKAKFGPKEQEISKRGQDLVAKQAEFQKTAATLSDTARLDAQRDIETTQKVLQRDTDDARADVQAEENRLLGVIMQKMQGVLQRYATDKQISMIVDLSSQPNNLLYADKSVNITVEIIGLYDKAATLPVNAVPAAPKSVVPAATPGANQPAPKKPVAPGPAKQE
jgi:outer membrane protein